MPAARIASTNGRALPSAGSGASGPSISRIGVVDPEPGQGGQDVLDGVDLGRPVAQNRPAHRRRHVPRSDGRTGICGDSGRSVRTKREPAVRLRRAEGRASCLTPVCSPTPSIETGRRNGPLLSRGSFCLPPLPEPGLEFLDPPRQSRGAFEPCPEGMRIEA